MDAKGRYRKELAKALRKMKQTKRQIMIREEQRKIKIIPYYETNRNDYEFN